MLAFTVKVDLFHKDMDAEARVEAIRSALALVVNQISYGQIAGHDRDFKISNANGSAMATAHFGKSVLS